MNRHCRVAALVLALGLRTACAPAEDLNLEIPTAQINIYASPFEESLWNFPGSASVIAAERVALQGRDHLQDLVPMVPSLNWAGGTSRPKFFQIRGIGELEQYEGAPNPSVGVIIDDFDLSGIGSPAGLFDIEQVEVLHGPQSMRYGASALAGIINLRSYEPTSILDGRAQFTAGSDDLIEGGLAVGGPVSETVLLRVSAFQHNSNGFRHNLYLDRHNSNARDELSSRVQLRLQPSADTKIDLGFIGFDFDNGYDAFAINNAFTTQSDHPGEDSQRTTGGKIKIDSALNSDLRLVSLSTISRSHIDYSYDGDWGNNPFWEPYAPYDYFSDTRRTRETSSQELRLSSSDDLYVQGESWRWLFGLFGQHLTEDSSVSELSESVEFDFISSDYRANTLATFGEVEAPLTSGTSLNLALRGERRDSRYFDSRGADFEPVEGLYGGALSTNVSIDENARAYLLFSRGFKGGGFNPGPSVPGGFRDYNAEYLWNLETGIRTSLFAHRLNINAALFYDWRREQQIKLAIQDSPSDPLSYTYVTKNAARGENYGLELELEAKPWQWLSIFCSGALIETEFTEVSQELSYLDGRAQSHAPTWQYALGLKTFFDEHFYAQTLLSGKDGFYFDDSHNQRSNSYNLLDISVGYQGNGWRWSIWTKNTLDEKYAVRGFYFGNEPPDFAAKEYVQRGDPFQIGSTIEYRF